MIKSTIKGVGVALVITELCVALLHLILYFLGDDLTYFYKMYITMPLIVIGLLVISIVGYILSERI